MKLETLKRQFLLYLEGECGRSVKTIENYDRYLSRFLAQTKVTTPAAITPAVVRSFSEYLLRQPGAKVGARQHAMKPKTKNYYLIAIRAFLRFLHYRGIPTLSPKHIRLEKVSLSPPRFVSVSDLSRLLAMPKMSTLPGMRDCALLSLLCSTGLRVAELCQLSLSDIDLSHDVISVRGPGGAVRVMVPNQATKRLIARYISARKDTSRALFVRYGRKAHLGIDQRMTPRAVQRLIKRYAAEAGITSVITPNVIRHSFASDLLHTGADLRSLQIILGHAHGSSTHIYHDTVAAPRSENRNKYRS